MREYLDGKIIIVGLTLLFLIVGMSGCITEPLKEPPVVEKQKFDVHEWGYF